MRNILVLIKNNLRIDILKNPISFLISLFAPILILFFMLKVIGTNSGYINIGIVDDDSSKTSQVIEEVLKKQKGFNINEIKKEDISNLFAENSISVAIEIEDGFEKSIINGDINEVNITTIENDGVGSLIKNLINIEMNNIRDISIASEKNDEIYYRALENYINSNTVNIDKKSLNDLYSEYFSSQIFIGFIIMFMLLRGMKTAYRIFDEKDENIHVRIFISPVKASEYYLAGIISGYITLLIQVVLGVLSIRVLNLETGLSSLELFVILALVGLVSVSLALCCGAFAQNINEASNIFNFANILVLMIGGTFVPLEMLPPLIEKISYFTPIRWAMEAISAIQQGASFSEIYKYLLMVLLFAIAFFVIAAYKTVKEEKKININ